MGARQVVGAMVIAWGMAGCAGGVTEPEPTLGARVAELASPNGRNLNGRNLNGRNLNGRNLNDADLSGMLVSVNYAGAWSALASGDGTLDSVWLEGSVLQGVARGRALSGAEFIGARFVGNLGDGGKVDLRVDDIEEATGEHGDIWSYRISYRSPEDGLWYPACTADDGTALGAIPVAGAWDYREGVPGGGAKIDDPTVFTFACEGAAIAKCVRFGYRPWATSAYGQSLANHHQACTRMVRADFCGDGVSYTKDGNWVNLFDAVGVQQDTETWNHEAEWDANGARCFSDTSRTGGEPVTCTNKGLVPGCGLRGHFRTGTLLMSEVPGTGVLP